MLAFTVNTIGASPLLESVSNRRLQEQCDALQAMCDLYADRFQDGFLPVGGGYPGKNAKQGGRNAPTLWTEFELDEYRNVSRILYETVDYVTGLIDRVVDYTCGRGFAWTPYKQGESPASDAADIPPELKNATTALDAFKRRDRWRSREREIVNRGHIDGEAFLRLFRSAAGRPPACRTVEPEWVARPNIDPDNIGPWAWGVLTDPDDIEKPLAYHVRNPNRPQQDGEIVFAGGLLPEEEELARELIERLTPSLPIGPGRAFHFKCNVKRTQKRGMPTLFAAASGYTSAQKLLKNIVDTAAYQAAIAFIRKHVGATPTAVQDFAGNFANQGTVKQLGIPGASRYTVRDVPISSQTGGTKVFDTTDNTNYEPGPTTAGTPNYILALQAILRRGGVRVGAPEYLSSGDASNGNYASTKEAGSPFVVATEGRQQDLADFEEGIADAVLAMSRPVDGQPISGVCVAVQPPPVAIKSELETSQQNQIEHQAGVLSATTWQKRVGLKPEVEQVNIAKEREMNPDQGAMLPIGGDSSGGGSGYAGAAGNVG